jgi:hypothetical protein
MEYIGFVFGIFGLLAYLQVSGMKKRVDQLERALTAMKGSPLHEDRKALLAAAESYIGEKVNIDLKEDHEDADIALYGNTKHGSNTILDADEEWMLVRIETPKAVKEKLIRMKSIERISVIQ